MTEYQRNDVLLALEEGVMCATGKVELSEPGIVTVFRAYRDGETVIITLIDHGSRFHALQYRYFCIARMEEDGRRKAAGNGGATPVEALENMHWHELDSANYPPPPSGG